MTTQIIAANRLRDGLVVYQARDGGWSEHIAEAQLVHDETTGAAALTAARASVDARLVVDPALIDVATAGEAVRPTRLRELIRATGPTVRRDLGKQAEL